MSSSTQPLRLACIDADAPPLFGKVDHQGRREGFEPAVAALVAEQLGRPLQWVTMPWGSMLPSVQRHEVDAVLCGQGIIPSREEQVDFTRPYGVFHEGVLMRRGERVDGPDGLAGKRVAAIADSANMALANTFEGAEVRPFGDDTDDVYDEMLSALRSHEVDAVVDDDVVFVPLGASDPVFELAFVVPTGNRWGMGVAKDRPELLATLDAALGQAIRDGRHREAWQHWLPTLDYPF